MKVIYCSDFYLQLFSLGFHTLGRIFNKIALKKLWYLWFNRWNVLKET